MSLSVRRGATVPAGEELRRQLLALVLAAVLVWYTFVVPAHASAWSSGGVTPDDEGVGGEVRGLVGAQQFEKDEAGRKNESRSKDESRAIDELDWPEFIYPDGD